MFKGGIKIKKLALNVSILTVAAIFVAASMPVFGATLHVVKQPYVTVIVGGFDKVPGALGPDSNIGPIEGPEFGSNPPTLEGPYEILQWVNAAHPNSPANEWFYTGSIDTGDWMGDVFGGSYDGNMDGSNLLEYPGVNTSDAMWLLKPQNAAWCNITVESDIVAFSMKPDANDGIANFIVDEVIVATIDMYHDDASNYVVERTPPTIEANEYYLPIIVLVDLRDIDWIGQEPGIQAANGEPIYHTLAVELIAKTQYGPDWANDAEIFGAAAIVNSAMVPEPGTLAMLLFGFLAMRLRGKK